MVAITSRSRFRNLIILVALLVAVLVGLYQVNRLIQELPAQQFSSLSKQFNHTGYALEAFRMLERSQHELQKALSRTQNERDAIMQRLEALEAARSAIISSSKDDQDLQPLLIKIKDKVIELENASHIFKKQLSLGVKYLPLKVIDSSRDRDDHVYHYFMSVFKGRGMVEGPPDLFTFPSDRFSHDRLLCFKGNHTSDGTQNFYAFAFKEGLPIGASVVPGITLISDTYWDFNNPWHAMYDLLQFVYWRIDNGCANAANLLLFHQGEYRKEMGNWIKRVMEASGLPTSVLKMNASRGGRSYEEEESVCFERAVVSRSGIGGMKKPLLRRMYTEARCQARRSCNVRVDDNGDGNYEKADGSKRHVNITLMVRQGGRGFVDEGAWQQVVKQRCEAAVNCSWSVMYVANLTFCQQVEAMSYTDILVTAHGAQLANMIFMSPGRRVMEMFPAGWLEMAGHGQFIYKHLANWLGLHHEGYWRDPSTPPCPNPSDASACFSHYKDQPLGLNGTHIDNWLEEVITHFQSSYLLPSASPPHQDQTMYNPPHLDICECDAN